LAGLPNVNILAYLYQIAKTIEFQWLMISPLRLRRLPYAMNGKKLSFLAPLLHESYLGISWCAKGVNKNNGYQLLYHFFALSHHLNIFLHGLLIGHLL